MKCVNCKKSHKANDKLCSEYKKEEAALLKANAEHLSVGYAKKLLSHQMNYARAAQTPQTSNNISNLSAFDLSKVGGLPNRRNIIPTETKEIHSVIGDSTKRVEAMSAGTSNSSERVQPSKNISVRHTEISNSYDSLPDLEEDTVKPQKKQKNKSRKRERQYSSSPPLSPTPSVSNRYDVLSTEENTEIRKNLFDIQETSVRPKEKRVNVGVQQSSRKDNLEKSFVNVEVHQSSQKDNTGKSTVNIDVNQSLPKDNIGKSLVKPNINRPSSSHSISNQKSSKKDTGTKGKQHTSSNRVSMSDKAIK